MTAVTVKSNKIVSNEVTDNKTLLEPSNGKRWTSLFTNPILVFYSRKHVYSLLAP